MSRITSTTITVVTYEWHDYTRTVAVYQTRAEAEQAVKERAQEEAPEETGITSLARAQEVLAGLGHTVYVDAAELDEEEIAWG